MGCKDDKYYLDFKLGRSARLEVVSEGILEEGRFKPGLEGWVELRKGWGAHSRGKIAQIV